MLTQAPGCRPVCKDAPASLMDELVHALVKQRRRGLTEANAVLLVGESTSLADLFDEGSLGRRPAVAASLIESGCATCAVNKAFARRLTG